MTRFFTLEYWEDDGWYVGRELTWSWAMSESRLDLSPPKYEFGDLPIRPVAVPGKTKPV